MKNPNYLTSLMLDCRPLMETEDLGDGIGIVPNHILFGGAGDGCKS